ncbi:tryptophan synthase subunit alpha [Bacillus cabrialesii]
MKQHTVEAMFKDLERKGQKALIPYIPVGYPRLDETIDYIECISKAGADMIELGVPFSDPLADGPVIQEAAQIALQQGVTLRKCLETVKAIRTSGNTIPIALMGYCNSFSAYQFETFAADAEEAGVNALIIPDLPPEMSENWVNCARKHHIDIIFFIAPTTKEERIEVISKAGSGFIYCISDLGVTGERDTVPVDLPEFINHLRGKIKLPLAIGFGISTPDHVREVSSFADGAIVGSALIRLIKETPRDERLQALSVFISNLKDSTKSVHLNR